MNSAKQNIIKKEEELKILKAKYDHVMLKLKKDAKEYNANYIGNIARRVMCYYFNEYVPFYEYDYEFNRKFAISKSQRWGEKPGFVDNPYFLVYRYDAPRGTQRSSTPVGFICHHADFITSLRDDEKLKLWHWYCKNKRYTNSYDAFLKALAPKGSLNIFDVYNDYLQDTRNYSYILELINEPSLKIKNIVLCITDLS